MNELKSPTEVFVKINECAELPPDKLHLNLDVVTLKDNNPAPNQVVMLQIDEQMRKITTNEYGAARNTDVIFQHVQGVRAKLKTWVKCAEDTNVKVFEYDVILDTSPLTEEEIIEKEYELIRAKDSLAKSVKKYKKAQHMEGVRKEKLEQAKSEVERAKIELERMDEKSERIRGKWSRALDEYDKTNVDLKEMRSIIKSESDSAKSEYEVVSKEWDKTSEELYRVEMGRNNASSEYDEAKEILEDKEKIMREAYVKVSTLEKFLKK